MNDNDAIYCKNCGDTDFQLQNSSSWNAVDIVKDLGCCNMMRWLYLLFLIMLFSELIVGVSTLFDIRSQSTSLSQSDTETYGQLISYIKIILCVTVVIKLGINFSLWNGIFKFRETSKLFSNDSFNPQGLKIIRTTVIVNLFFSSGVIVCAGLLLNNFNRLYTSVENDIVSIANLVRQSNSSRAILLTFTIALLFLLVYNLLLVKTINSIITTASTDTPSSYVSMFVVVINFILAFFKLFDLFSEGILNFLYSGITIAFYILFSLLLLKYRKDMITYMYSVHK
jgi:hypothetical protein